MKTHLAALIIACSAFAAPPPITFVPQKENHTSLEVKTVATKMEMTDQFQTNYGSYDQHTERSRAVEIVVRTYGNKAEPFTVLTYWIGKRTATNSRVILKKQKGGGEGNPGPVEKFTSSSGNVKGSDMNLAIIGYRSTEGYRIEGWIVVAARASDNAILAIKASSPGLEAIARSEEEMARLSTARE